MKRYILTLGLACSSLAFTGCEDFLAEEPVHLITTDVAITNATNAQLALNGAYETLQYANMYGQQLVLGSAVLSDELMQSIDGSFPQNQEFDNNDVQTENVSMVNIWNSLYYTIHAANNIIERVPQLEDIAEEERNRLVGEAKFIRALSYYQIAVHWGGAPLALGTDVTENSSLERATLEATYAQIISDLTDAESSVNDSFDTPADNRNRATVGAVRALLARVYLFTGNYAQAEAKATQVIESPHYNLEPNYADVFAGNSSESIFEVYYSSLDANSLAFWNFPQSLGGRWEYAPTAEMVAAYETDDEGNIIDERAAYNISENPDVPGEYYVAKYRDVATGTDQPIVLRLAEMYLIRAEARAQQGELADAEDDLNMVRNRAGLDDITGLNQNALLEAISDERFVELAFEGHRWAYLVGTGRVQEVMSVHNPGTWTANDARLPIPRRETELNSNIEQNPGY